MRREVENAAQVRIPRRILASGAWARVMSCVSCLTTGMLSRKSWRILQITSSVLLVTTILSLLLSVRYTICYVALVDDNLLINTHIVAGRFGIMLGRLPPTAKNVTSNPTEHGFFVRDAAGSIRLFPPFGTVPLGLGARLYYVELWLIAVPLVLSVVVSRIAIYFHVRRQRALHNCLNCGYSLQGNQTGVCPECGIPHTGNARALP